jgi:hypothetical protein
LIGQQQRKVIALRIKIKACQVCKRFEEDVSKTEAGDIPDHDCLRNHIGTSGSMGADVLVKLIHELFDTYNCTVDCIVTDSDDDSTMRAHTRWSNEDYEKNYHRPVPRFPVGNA